MYTHYWKWDAPLDPQAFVDWSADVRLLAQHLPEHSITAGGYYDHAPLKIGGPNNEGTGDPVFSPGMVGFNGSGIDPLGDEELSCSVFSIRREHMQQRFYDFCPTGRKPYDLLICAALIRLKIHFPSIKVGSDGVPREWLQAVRLCQQLFGNTGGTLPFTEGEEFESPNWT